MNGTLFGNSAPATARRTPTLRPYQIDFMDQGRALMGAGHRMIVMQMATGGGKGTVSAAMFHAAMQKGKRCLFLAHRKKLVTQKGDRLDQYGVPYTILMPGHRFDSSCPVVVASKDTLLSRAFRSSRMGLPPADMVLVDECHAATSPEYLELLSRYKGAYIVGMSATPADPDGNGLGKYGYTGLATAISTSRLVKEGHLVPVKAFHPEGVEAARRGKKARGKTKLAGDPVRHWLDYAAGRPTVLFAGRVEYSKGLVAKFNAAGIPAEHMDGTTPEDDREAMIDRVEAGVTKVLSNCAVLTVGVDIPCLSCIQIVKTMGSYIDFAQSCGRIMRPFPGKEFSIILDHSGAVDRHGFPDEDTEWALDYDGTIEEKNKKAKKEGKRLEPIVCPRCACLFSGTTTCPNCHHELPTNKKKESVLTQAELLVECRRGEAAKSTVESQLARACTEWSKFVRIAAHKGRTVGMASVMFRSLFKCWPEKYPGLGERLRGGPWRLPDGWQMRHPAMDVYGHAVKGGS